MLDTAGHKEDAKLDAVLEGYFPDVTPRRDGGHLYYALGHGAVAESVRTLAGNGRGTTAADRPARAACGCRPR